MRVGESGEWNRYYKSILEKDDKSTLFCEGSFKWQSFCNFSSHESVKRGKIVAVGGCLIV
jgi:hypothetical protein